MDISNPKELDPICANCKHPWSAHAVNDPQPRCSLKVVPGKESWCACGGFQYGCATCGHRMISHGTLGLERCHDISGRDRCSCRGYEASE